MVVLSSSGEKVFRTDRSENTSTTKEKDASGGERDAVSSQLEENTVFSQSAGQNTGNGPLIEKELYPQISGIVISAQGGDLRRSRLKFPRLWKHYLDWNRINKSVKAGGIKGVRHMKIRNMKQVGERVKEIKMKRLFRRNRSLSLHWL